MSNICRSISVGLLSALISSFSAWAAPVPPLAPDAPAADTIDLTTASAISFGGEASDQFAIEGAEGAGGVVALVTPHSEDCTLRFSILVGDTLRLRASSDDGKRAVCEIALVSVLNTSTARFAYSCQIEAWADNEPKCPVAAEAAPASVSAAQ